MSDSYRGDVDSRDEEVVVENSQFSQLENLLLNAKSTAEDTVSGSLTIVRNGKNVKLDIKFKKLTYSQYSNLKKAVTKTRKGVPDTDYDKYRMRVVTDLLVDPNFNKKSLLDDMGVVTAEQGLNKFFYAGEIVELSDLILEASGFKLDPFRDSVSDNES